jgi:hypothetical protein
MLMLHTPLPETRFDLAAQDGECFRSLSDRNYCEIKLYGVDYSSWYSHADTHKGRTVEAYRKRFRLEHSTSLLQFAKI